MVTCLECVGVLNNAVVSYTWNDDNGSLTVTMPGTSLVTERGEYIDLR